MNQVKMRSEQLTDALLQEYSRRNNPAAQSRYENTSLTLRVDGDQETGCFLTLFIIQEECPIVPAALPTVGAHQTYTRRIEDLSLSLLHALLEHLHHWDSDGHIRLGMQGDLETLSHELNVGLPHTKV